MNSPTAEEQIVINKGGSFSIEAQLVAGLRELEMSVAFFGALQSDVSSSRITQALSGVAPLDGGKMLRLHSLFQEIKKLADEHKPFTIRWRDPAMVRRILEQRRLKAVPFESGWANA